MRPPDRTYWLLSLILCLSLYHQGLFALELGEIDKPQCEGLLQGSTPTSAFEAHRGVLEDTLLEEQNYQPSVRISEDSLSDERLRVEKVDGLPWHSFHHTIEKEVLEQVLQLDLQGDPRGIFRLSPHLAHYLGFEMVGENSMLVPKVELLNKNLDRLSDALEEDGEPRIQWRFYHQEKISFAEYMEKASRYELPVAAPAAGFDGNHFIHDISYHTTVIALPPEYSDRIAFAAKEFKDTYEQLDLDQLGIEKNEVTEALIHQMRKDLRMIFSSIVDSATANPGSIGAYFRIGDAEHFDKSIHEFVTYILRKLPVEHVMEVFKQHTQGMPEDMQEAPGVEELFYKIQDMRKAQAPEWSSPLTYSDPFRGSFIEWLEVLANEELYNVSN